MVRAFRGVSSVKIATTVLPRMEGNTAAAGTSGQASDATHRHERLSSSTGGTLEANNGEATITFTRSFVKKPGLSIALEEDADGGALAWKVRNWTQNAQSEYTAVRIKVYRVQPMPTQATINVLSLLGGVITGLNNLLQSLSGFRVDQGTVGALPYTCLALQRSD